MLNLWPFLLSFSPAVSLLPSRFALMFRVWRGVIRLPVFISYNLIIYLLFSSPDSHTLPMWRSTQNGEEKDPPVYLDAKHMLVLWLHSRSDRFRFSHLNSVNQRLVLLSVAITEIVRFQSAVCRTISDKLIHTDKSCKSHCTRTHSLLHPPPQMGGWRRNWLTNESEPSIWSNYFIYTN